MFNKENVYFAKKNFTWKCFIKDYNNDNLEEYYERVPNKLVTVSRYPDGNACVINGDLEYMALWFTIDNKIFVVYN